MTDNEDLSRTLRAQKLTCVCCTLCHKNELELKIHLRGMIDRTTAQLARLEPKPPAAKTPETPEKAA